MSNNADVQMDEVFMRLTPWAACMITLKAIADDAQAAGDLYAAAQALDFRLSGLRLAEHLRDGLIEHPTDAMRDARAQHCRAMSRGRFLAAAHATNRLLKLVIKTLEQRASNETT